jgi:hypothetical protein
MQLRIAGVYVLFQAIESFRFDEETSELVVRTMSGKEYRRTVSDKATADRTADAIIERMALCSSL